MDSLRALGMIACPYNCPYFEHDGDTQDVCFAEECLFPVDPLTGERKYATLTPSKGEGNGNRT